MWLLSRLLKLSAPCRVVSLGALGFRVSGVQSLGLRAGLGGHNKKGTTERFVRAWDHMGSQVSKNFFATQPPHLLEVDLPLLRPDTFGQLGLGFRV